MGISKSKPNNQKLEVLAYFLDADRTEKEYVEWIFYLIEQLSDFGLSSTTYETHPIISDLRYSILKYKQLIKQTNG